MKEFRSEVTEQLLRRGIDVRFVADSMDVGITPKGLAWVFNYVYLTQQPRGVALSPALFRNLATFTPVADEVRTFIIHLAQVPAYDSYYSFPCLYLDGSPPRAFFMVNEDFFDLQPPITLSSTNHDNLFTIKAGVWIQLQLSPNERNTLNDAHTLRVDII